MTFSTSPQTCHISPQISCGKCRLSSLCLPISLQLEDIGRLDAIIQQGRPFQKADSVYYAGDRFHSIYAVRSGAVKTFTNTSDGREQITGFYLPGEIIGMDGLATNHYTNTAVALETSALCEIPFDRLEELSSRLPKLQRRFFQLMSKEISNDQQLITLLSKNSAEERIAALLLSISARYHHQGLSADEFYLPMSRSDIGNFLGLTIETVSRIMGRLHKLHIIVLDKKHIIIRNMKALQTLSIHTEADG